MTKEKDNDLNNICVFCGSSGHVDPAFLVAASDTGRILAENGWGVVFGGAKVGMMGLVADGALAAGGEVTGVIPADLIRWEIQHDNLTTLIEAQSMHDRKMEMVNRSDAFVVLPGGLGTLDETFEIITWRQIGLHDKPVILVNIDGYWDKMIDLMRHLIAEKFARDLLFEYVSIVDHIDDIPAALRNAPRSIISPKSKWM